MTTGRERTLGFTVIELLVAVAVTVVLAGILLTVTRSALDIWGRSLNQSASSVQAKVALDLLIRDLHSAIYRADGEATMAVDIVSGGNLGAHSWRLDYAGANKPDTVAIYTPATEPSGRYMETSRFGRGGAWLRLLTTNQRSGGGAPAMIGYQLNRRPVSGPVNATNPPPVRYTLFRSFMAPGDTFAAGYTATDCDAALTAPRTDDALCDNVVDFGVWCYRRNSDGTLTVLYPTALVDRDFRATNNQFPDVVEVMLRVLTDSGATQLDQMEAGLVQRPAQYATGADWWWGVVSTQSQIYHARVNITGGGAR